MAAWVVARWPASCGMLQPSASRACRQPRRSAKPRRLACWSRWRWWPPSTVKPPFTMRRRGKRAGGGVTHALGVPGAPPLRETRHDQGISAGGALPIGPDQAHGQRRERLGLPVCERPELLRLYAPRGGAPIVVAVAALIPDSGRRSRRRPTESCTI